ncbi:MAG: T9SS type A sorting domain-containing protein [Bacteroidia bacterium]|jgi:photosystem II stability/assembly factor-like uncharacterized protein
MKKTYLGIAFLSLALGVKAQTGIHLQQYNTSAYVYNEDSVYMSVNVSDDFSRMALVNPVTKVWKYLNTVDYGKYLGPFVMKNPMEGVMLYTSSSKVYKTTDGWQTLNEVSGAPSGFIQVINTGAGYLAYQAFLKDFYFSADGTTWTMTLDAGSGTNAMAAKNNKVFILTGASFNFTSSDGGQTFTNVPFTGSMNGNFKEMVMVGEDTLVVATDSHLYKSFDGGQTWSNHAFPATLQSITIKDTAEMFICTPLQNYHTSDGGATWQMKDNTATGPGDYIGDNLFIWPNYKSTDDGATWSAMFPKTLENNTIFDLYFKGNIGLVGKGGGKVICSFDRGCSFGFDITLPTSEDIMAVKILNNGDFIAGDRKSQIFISSDNGQTWTQRYTNTFTYNAIKFSHSDNDSIILETRAGQPIVSSDFGATFDYFTAGGGTHSQTVKPNGEIIDAGGWFDYSLFQNKGIEISRFTPTGTETILDTFLIASNAATEAVADIQMASNAIGYLVTNNSNGSSTKIYKTTNGFMGGTTLTSTINSFSATRLHVLSADTLMLTASSSPVYYYSYDGGTNWTQATLNVFTEYPSIYTSIKKAHFFDAENYIFALNNYGLYVNTPFTGSVPTAISEIHSPTSNGSALNVYPNPSDNIININYKGLADITIYDYSGRVVYKKLKTDTSNAIDVSNYVPGLYIITVESTNGIYNTRFVKQ